MRFEGSCFCGAVRFSFPRADVNWVAHCHCSMCRRLHAAPYVTWVSVKAASYRIDAGEAHNRRFDSSEVAHRHHCDVCGTQMSFRGGRWPDEVHVPRALIAGDDVPMPQMHGHWANRATWVHVGDDLPKKA